LIAGIVGDDPAVGMARLPRPARIC